MSDTGLYRLRQRPVIVKARQWKTEADTQSILEWCDGWTYTGTQHGHTRPPWAMHTCLNLNTSDTSPKGHADPGDWIVIVAEDPDGDTYEVLSQEEFEAKYEPAGPRAFDAWLAQEYPGGMGSAFGGRYSQDDMEEAFEAGRQLGKAPLS